MQPFCICGDCGQPCPTSADFLRHCDEHAGITRPADWYVPVSSRRSYAQWDDATAVLVLKGPEGQIRYPGSHQARVPKDYERVYLKSLREVEQFEKTHGVRNEMAWFDPGSGRGFDDDVFGKKETA